MNDMPISSRVCVCVRARARVCVCVRVRLCSFWCSPAAQNEAEEMRKEAEDEAAQRELSEFQLEKLRMQVLGMRTSA